MGIATHQRNTLGHGKDTQAPANHPSWGDRTAVDLIAGDRLGSQPAIPARSRPPILTPCPPRRKIGAYGIGPGRFLFKTGLDGVTGVVKKQV
jgi:hypothetical protein